MHLNSNTASDSNGHTVMLVRASNLEPVQYATELHRLLHTEWDGTLFLNDSARVSSGVNHDTVILLSGLTDVELQNLVPQIQERRPDNQHHITDLNIVAHRNPKMLFGEIIQSSDTHVLRSTKKMTLDGVIARVKKDFGAVTVEEGNVNIGNIFFGNEIYSEDDLKRLTKILVEGKREIATGLLGNLMEGGKDAKKSLLRSIFLTQTLKHGGNVLVKLRKNKNKNAGLSVVKNTDEIDDLYMDKGVQFLFAEQKRILKKLVPSLVDTGMIRKTVA